MEVLIIVTRRELVCTQDGRDTSARSKAIQRVGVHSCTWETKTIPLCHIDNHLIVYGLTLNENNSLTFEYIK